jgi:uncharacterized Fe-S cluster-containing radical SAM superfamily protein
MSLDPVKLGLELEKKVANGVYRRYYRRARPGGWYGGIASADCCGCNLRCVFCWSGQARDHPERTGKMYSAGHIFKVLSDCARNFGYTKMRITGNEPTIGRNHLFRFMELCEQDNFFFILETNGILLGYDSSYCNQLAKFRKIHVRVSLKGTNQTEFSMLTGAKPESFNLQLNALENLTNAGVSCNPAVMLSFSPKKNLSLLRAKIQNIDPSLADAIEEEYVLLYPITIERLNAARIKPLIAYDLHNVRKVA